MIKHSSDLLSTLYMQIKHCTFGVQPKLCKTIFLSGQDSAAQAESVYCLNSVRKAAATGTRGRLDTSVHLLQRISNASCYAIIPAISPFLQKLAGEFCTGQDPYLVRTAVTQTPQSCGQGL